MRRIHYNTWAAFRNVGKCPADDSLPVGSFNCFDCPNYRGEGKDDDGEYVDCAF